MFQKFIQHLLLVGAEAESSASAAASPDWWGVLAGLHPVLTHFPIALIIVAAGVEFVGLLLCKIRFIIQMPVLLYLEKYI